MACMYGCAVVRLYVVGDVNGFSRCAKALLGRCEKYLQEGRVVPSFRSS